MTRHASGSAAAALGLAFALSFATAAPLSAETVTPIAEVQRGTMVTVAGTVERILDTDEFRLADDSGSIRIYVGPNWVPAEIGESVSVRGFVDDGLSREIYARELTRADGTVVTFEHSYD